MERLLQGRDHEVTHPVDPPCRLLRARSQRPRRRRAAKKRDELAPSHLSPRRNASSLSKPSTLRWDGERERANNGLQTPRRNVRSGSIATERSSPPHVCFPPDSDR